MAELNDPQTPKGGLGRGGKILLYVSLAFNLAIVGLLIGAVAFGSDRADDRRPPSAGEGGFRPIMQALSAEDRRVMLRQMRGELRTAGKNRSEMRALMEDFVAAVAATPYDHARVEALIGAQMNEADVRLDVASRVFLNRVATMSDAERASFAARLVEELERPRGPRADKRDN